MLNIELTVGITYSPQTIHSRRKEFKLSQPFLPTSNVSPNWRPIFSSCVMTFGWMTITMFSRKITLPLSWRAVVRL